MSATYHMGERAVQERAGVRAMSERIGRVFQAEMKPLFRTFIAHQRLVVLATVDGHGYPWASLLLGPPGFLHTPDERIVVITAAPAPGDPLPARLRTRPEIGIVVIDFATWQRLRVNGTAVNAADGTIVVTTEQVYGNCQQYIQRRAYAADDTTAADAGAVLEGTVLSPAQQAWIAAADTFFVASAHPEAGADASHRGGPPGFVQVVDDRTLRWPDYAGNMMFNTLGNIAAHPQIGLLFLDFTVGRILQLAGRAEILWDEAAAAAFPGAQRLVACTIDHVRELRGAYQGRWEFIEPSPFNPSAADPADEPLANR
jgi:predicted pyridoxine 5'-phosphate oxidase superfamily flavin-nucleotide-binding protein